jgi:hypothetical protein
MDNSSIGTIAAIKQSSEPERNVPPLPAQKSQIDAQHERWKAARARLMAPQAAVIATAREPVRQRQEEQVFPLIPIPSTWFAEAHRLLDAIDPKSALNRQLRASATELEMLTGGAKTVLVAKIKREVAAKYGVTPADIESDRRQKQVVMPRHIAIYLSKRLTSRGLASIGRAFGGRDHTTCLHAIQKIERLRAADGQLNTEIEELVTILTGK